MIKLDSRFISFFLFNWLNTECSNFICFINWTNEAEVKGERSIEEDLLFSFHFVS